VRPHDRPRLPALPANSRLGKRLRAALVAIAAAALTIPSMQDASAQFGIGGFGGGFGRMPGGGFGRMPGGGMRDPGLMGAPMRGPMPKGVGLRGVGPQGQVPKGTVLRGTAGQVPGAQAVGARGAAQQGAGAQGRAMRGAGMQGARVHGSAAVRRPGLQATGSRDGGRVPPRCRGPGCYRPGGPGVIVGVPPLVVPPDVGPTGPVGVVQDGGPPPRAGGSGGPGRVPPTGGSATPPSSGSGRAISGVPPAGERRFLPDQVVGVMRAGLTDQQIDTFLRQNRLARTAGGEQEIALIGARVYRFRITDRRPVRTVIAALERHPFVVSMQPEYLYRFAQAQEAVVGGANPASAARSEQPPARDPTIERLQYAVGKLNLAQAHRVVRGGEVLVAVIDSRVDSAHPELAGAVVREIDVLDDRDGKPHSHGTAMAGAIVAKARLMGVAPDARLIAVRAFSVTSGGTASGTSFALTHGLDRAVAEGARIVNLSFAGPPDPLLSRALKAARERGVVLIAAAGNAGPRAAPLHPAADPNVIAVTATDASDKVYRGANRGKHIAVAAPGVDILVPGPQEAYEMSTGTSIAAAHVSGVAALLMARNPALDPDGVRKVLTGSARGLGARDEYGAGLTDAYNALLTVDPKAGEAVPLAGAPTQ
jgi:Subtilase family